jgi:hypothetical protein
VLDRYSIREVNNFEILTYQTWLFSGSFDGSILILETRNWIQRTMFNGQLNWIGKCRGQ